MIPIAWKTFLEDDCIIGERAAQAALAAEALGKEVYPPAQLRFRALEFVDPKAVRVVLMGQDPYHGPGQAMGLSFSVPGGVRIPASLRNIFKELRDDLGVEGATGDLTPWAQRGVLLLNAVLTVERGCPKSHHNLGWAEFTNAIVRRLSRQREGIVFMLWGKDAQSKREMIDENRHTVLATSHPSPMGGACYQGFFGSKPFSSANLALANFGFPSIDWRL